MLISLKVENLERLPDGGPLSYRSLGRSFVIGRENCDWTLPDPDRFISGRHCEIRFEAGRFWLYDVSRNGTFVNGSSQRIASPYRLGQGDRLRIGRYIVSVSLEDDQGERAWPNAADQTAGRHPPSVGPDPDAEDRDPSGFADSFVAGSAIRGNPASVGQGAGRAALPRAGHAPRQNGQQQHSQAHAPLPTSGRLAGADELLRGIALGAGIGPEVFQQRDPSEVAAEIGMVLRTVVEELAILLKARATAKVMAKSGHRTMVSAANNNPLKFVPRAEEILEIMFSQRRTGYLDARQTVEEAFRDLKTHEFATYSAMQSALFRLLEDLSPDTIEKTLPAASFALKKSRAWDAFVATWQSKEDAHENGMLDAFLTYFSEAYAKAANQK
jgi:type VI secretion system protein ImpI